MFSCIFAICFFTKRKLVNLLFSQIISYLYSFKLLVLRRLLNGSVPNNTVAPLSLIIRLYCSQSLSNGITLSHLQAVVPFFQPQGRSASIMSILLSAKNLIASIHSPCIKLFGFTSPTDCKFFNSIIFIINSNLYWCYVLL